MKRLLIFLLLFFTTNVFAIGFTDMEVEMYSKQWHTSKSNVAARLNARIVAAAKRDAKARAKTAAQLAKIKRVGNSYSY